MKVVLFIPTASVAGDQPSPWFKQLLDSAIAYSRDHVADTCTYLISGRWNNAEAEYLINEAEVGKRYVLSQVPGAHVLKETLAVETGGNFAFSKPFLDFVQPDRVVILNSAVKAERSKYLARKIFGPSYAHEFLFVADTFSDNPRAVLKEPKAISMFQKLFDGLADGDDQGAREILLYHTPFYYRGLIDDRTFFDQHWPGGFADFLEKRLSIDNK